MIDVPRRLRRALHLNDLTLVKRIVRNNPKYLRNPDFSDKSNTSLHLAAKHGFTEIAEFLIDAGHESESISRNNDYETPLMLAASSGQADVSVLLIKRFPECIPWTNKLGLDTLMLSSTTSTLPLIPLLLSAAPAIIHHRDIDGNTALHHASAHGQLKALRLLLQYGANPLAQNAYSWTPAHYSATSAAEVYFKNLIAEMERKRMEGRRAGDKGGGEGEKGSAGAGVGANRMRGGVRLVTSDEGVSPGRARDDMTIPGFPGPDWSPVQSRRAMTPTATRTTEGYFNDVGRARASSNE